MNLSESHLREYLLGRLPDEARGALEEAYFADQDLYDRLLEMQNDLVDAWARNALSPDDRRAVEERLLSGPSGSERKRLALTLARADHARGTQQAIPSRAASPHRFSAPLAIAATIAAIGVSTTLWLAMDNARLRRSIAATPAPAATDRGSMVASALPSSNAEIAEFRLAPGVVRSDQTPRTIQLPPQARLVRVLLETDDAAASFVAGVERAGAGRIWTQGGLVRRDGKTVTVWLPSELLTAGDYEILLWQTREDPATLAATYLVRIR
jgi:hypothetical protein